MVLPRQKILMCVPHRFNVSYVINPWMEEGLVGGIDKEKAWKQWMHLKEVLANEAEILYVVPQPGIPDFVFTANAGFVFKDQVIVSRFRTPERQKEEPFFRTWFENNGFKLAPWPQDIFFEGAGDALLDRGYPHIWCAHGYRTDQTVPKLIENLIGVQTITLQLVDPRFYHLDTCLCPLKGGYLMYFPEAFDAPSQQRIASLVPQNKRIVVQESDALTFSCNAVDINGFVIMNSASEELQKQLKKSGFTPVITPLSEFLKAGGAAKCLTLKLIEPEN